MPWRWQTKCFLELLKQRNFCCFGIKSRHMWLFFFLALIILLIHSPRREKEKEKANFQFDPKTLWRHDLWKGPTLSRDESEKTAKSSEKEHMWLSFSSCFSSFVNNLIFPEMKNDRNVGRGRWFSCTSRRSKWPAHLAIGTEERKHCRPGRLY